MALTVQDVIDRVSALLFDAGKVRWTEPELIRHINDAERAIAALKPDATASTAAYQLAAGVVQSLPANTIRLIDVHRNLGQDGATPGAQIFISEAETLGAYAPNWALAAASARVEAFAYDERDPLHFRVYPPVTGAEAVWVEVTRTALPGELAAATDVLAVGGWYFNNVVQYVMWLALAKDAEFSVLSNAAAAWKAQFDQELGQQTQTQLIASPNAALEGGEMPKTLRGGR